MTQPNTTRRDLLRFGTSAAAYAAGAAIVTGGVALASQAKGAAGISPGLLLLIARHDAADAAIDRFYATTFNPAVDRHHAMVAAIPHVVRESAPLPNGTRPTIWTTADRLSIAGAQGIAHSDPARSSQTEGWQRRRREARSFYAAHLRRERAVARTYAASGAKAVSAREDELWVPIREARQAIFAFPVASLADMAAKLDFVGRAEEIDGGDLMAMVETDVARLIGREA